MMMKSQRRLASAGLLTGALLAAMVSMAACGGTEPASKNVAELPATSSAAASTPPGSPVEYAKCMRQNGVPDFPDPGPGGGFQFDKSLADTQAFKDAQAKCADLMPTGDGPKVVVQQSDPNGNWTAADKLKYAKCMRANGEPKYPDPDADGNTIMDQSTGIDPNSPQFKKAEEACKQYLPQNAQGGQTHAPGGNG